MFKTLSSLITLVAAAFTVTAQPVFTSADNPGSGDSFTYYNVSAAIRPGAAGANVTWDFSSMVAADHYGGKYDSCSAILDCSMFPGSNFVFRNFPAANVIFYAETAAAYAQTGILTPAGNTYIYSDPIDILHYPVHYSDNFIDSYACQFSNAGYDYQETGRNKVNVDAWGTLKLPTGTFDNVLRTLTVNVYTDSVLHIAPFNTYDSVVSYAWFSPGYRESLLSMYKFYQNRRLVDSGISYTGQLPSAVPQVAIDPATFSIYPNPAKEEINIRFGISDQQTIRFVFTDMVGREVATIANDSYTAGQHEIKFTMPALAQGIYFIDMRTRDGLIVTKRVVIWS